MITIVVLNSLKSFTSSSLTAAQRWQALHLFNRVSLGENWFIAVCGAVLLVLIMLFIAVTYLRTRKERNTSNRLFIEYADKRGLSPRECSILMDIASKAKLRRKESIFIVGDCFDRGATQLVRFALAKYGAPRSRSLSAELSILREKLGFIKKENKTSADSVMRPGEPDSRQIPVGKKLYLTSPEINDFFEVEAIIKENNDLELVVELKTTIELRQPSQLCARYYFKAFVWEFDTSVISNKDNLLVLQHSDTVRHVNRRRFFRAQVNEAAYIAAFPFARTISEQETLEENKGTDNSNKYVWGPPEFVPADVTELAGPGLRVLAPLKVKVGDRVALILKLSPGKNRNSLHHDKFSKIVEDIGIVRHTKAIEDKYSIAIELTGLNDSNISELVRATNIASINAASQQITAINDGKENKWEVVSGATVG